MSSVTVLCPNGRRYNIKVSPNTPLLTVLEEACKKHGSDPSQHALKHQRKVVDLSRMFRHAGLPNNAKLELVPAQQNQARSVKVAIQLGSGDRLQGIFPPTLSLYELITSLHGNNQWVTDDVVVVYMRREVCGEAALNTTSLKDLGVYGGSVVLRLIYREHTAMDTSSLDNPVEQVKPINPVSEKPGSPEVMLLESCTGREVVMDISNDVTSSHDATSVSHDPTNSSHDVMNSSHDATSSSQDPTSSSHDPTSSSHDATSSSQDPTSSSNEAMSSSHDTTCSSHDVISSSHDLAATPTNHTISGSREHSIPIIKKPAGLKTRQSSHDPTKYDEPCDRHMLVFNMADYTSSVSYELPDSFFDVTASDCAIMQQDLRHQVKNLTDAPMMTAYHRQAAQLTKYSHYETAVVRIQFPDHWVMQGHFKPNESLKALVKFVREHLIDPTIKFYLYTTPPKTVFTSAKLTLLQAGLVPASIVHFGLHDNQGDGPYLKPEVLEQVVAPLQADVVSVTTRGGQSPAAESFNHDIMKFPSNVPPSSGRDFPIVPIKQPAAPYKQATPTTNKPSGMPKWFKHSGGKKL